MIHPKAHKTKWTALNLKHRTVERFTSREECATFCLYYGHPWALIPPIYRFEE